MGAENYIQIDYTGLFVIGKRLFYKWRSKSEAVGGAKVQYDQTHPLFPSALLTRLALKLRWISLSTLPPRLSPSFSRSLHLIPPACPSPKLIRQ